MNQSHSDSRLSQTQSLLPGSISINNGISHGLLIDKARKVFVGKKSLSSCGTTAYYQQVKMTDAFRFSQAREPRSIVMFLHR